MSIGYKIQNCQLYQNKNDTHKAVREHPHLTPFFDKYKIELTHESVHSGLQQFVFMLWEQQRIDLPCFKKFMKEHLEYENRFKALSFNPKFAYPSLKYALYEYD